MSTKPTKTFDELAGAESIAQQLMKETVIDDLRFTLRLAQKQAKRISLQLDVCSEPKEAKRLDSELFKLIREMRLAAAQIERIEKDCRRRAKELGESEGAEQMFNLLQSSESPPETTPATPEQQPSPQHPSPQQHPQAPPTEHAA